MASAADEQRRLHENAIGRGADDSTIQELRTFAQCAPVHERFEQYAEIRFVYEMLSMTDGFTKVSALLDSWVNVRSFHLFDT